MSNIFPLLLVLALAVAAILLQIFLSKKEGKWFGLILPAISFIVSLLVVISIVAYTNIGITSYSTSSEDGVIISHEIEDTRPAFGSVTGAVVITFLLMNIPTVVLIAIYGACREKKERRLALEKMQIQDLE